MNSFGQDIHQWGMWRMPGKCRVLIRRLQGWERELLTNEHGWASTAPRTIQAIKEMMRAHGCQER